MKEVSSLENEEKVSEKVEEVTWGENGSPVPQNPGQEKFDSLRKEERKGEITTHVSLNHHHKYLAMPFKWPSSALYLTSALQICH